MGRMELEVKILNVEKKEIIKKIEDAGGTFIEEIDQYLYTYDLATIYARFVDTMIQLNEPESNIKYETALSKLRLLFFELDNLVDNEETKKIIGYKTFTELLNDQGFLDVLNSNEVNEYLKKYRNNSKKWIRLRQSNAKTTLAVKHILKPNDTKIQQMLETEIEVPSIKEANALLEALGFSYKSYQEKNRVTYKLDGYDIDIDTWPNIPVYFEVEGNTEEEIDKVLKKLGYSIKDAISCTADEVYAMYGKSHFDKRELKFEDK
jgi:adenylate cyclase class 2